MALRSDCLFADRDLMKLKLIVTVASAAAFTLWGAFAAVSRGLGAFDDIHDIASW